MSTAPAVGTVVQFRSRVSRRMVLTATVLPDLDTHVSRAFATDPVDGAVALRITAVTDFYGDSDCTTLPVDTTPDPALPWRCRPCPLPDNTVWLVAADRLVPVVTAEGDVAVRCANGAVMLVDPGML